MIKVGLSGTRLSGKNKVAHLFENIGVSVFDADLVLRFILTQEHILEQIKNKIGLYYFTNGSLDVVKVVKDSIFNEILTIIEPTIFSAYFNFEKENYKSIYTIFNSSILFDRKWYKRMDYNISVYTPFIHRVERAKKINEIGFENITSINHILNKEDDEFSKNSFANYVIHNYNEFDIKKQVEKIDQSIIDLYLKREYNKELP
jgi:dephospho-CoA kinase